ncbi:histidine phosphatase family protein [Pontibacter sp. KCTC 32443]|uniref:SixA phosphatase family protein n=1 Tax=Pontibacter TaxID=323449 RepID=UPI00164D645E|nr:MULTISPECIES: histidine phosphatase family protein [Pontibacter]MBC5773606.1 histidine phosphatase family protein [Pontibacter sp. KCTC 32443]
MQRHLLICRHAETFDPYPLQPDFERELTPEGIRQAHELGKWIREYYQKADAILASPAKRASDTARIVASRLYFEQDNITYDPEIYNPKEAQLLKSISQLPAHVKKIVLVSHNPALTQLLRNLVNRSLPYLVPAQVAAVALDLEQWQDIYVRTGELEKMNLQQSV